MDLKEDLSKAVGINLKRFTERFSQIKVAKSIEVKAGRITDIINGESKYLSYYQMYILNKEYGVDLNELITGQSKSNMTQTNGENASGNIQIMNAKDSEIETLKELVKAKDEMIKMLKAKIIELEK